MIGKSKIIKNKGIFNFNLELKNDQRLNFKAISAACRDMSKNKTGAIIIITQIDDLAVFCENGVEMNALVSADDFDFNTDEFGPDAQQNVVFSFLRQAFIDASMVLEIGDLIDWNYGYFEVGSINENQLVGGQFDQNFSVVATTFLIRKSSIQIERVRSI